MARYQLMIICHQFSYTLDRETKIGNKKKICEIKLMRKIYELLFLKKLIKKLKFCHTFVYCVHELIYVTLYIHT